MKVSVCQKVRSLFKYSLPDYYNYYYGGYYQNPEAADTQEGLNAAAAEEVAAVVDGADGSEAAEVSTPTAAVAAVVADESGQPDSSVTATTEVSFIRKLVIS